MVVLIVVTVILWLVSLLLLAEAQGLEAKQKRLKEMLGRGDRNIKQETLVDRENAVMAMVGQAAEPTGFAPEGEGGELPVAKVLEFHKKKLGELFPEGERKTVEGTRQFGTLQELSVLAATRMLVEKNRYEQLVLELEIARHQASEAGRRKEEVLQPKETLKKRLEEGIREINTKIAGENQDFTARSAELTQERDKVGSEIEAQQKEYGIWNQKMDNQIRKLREDLNELKVKEVIKHDINVAYARVLKPDIVNRIAFLDLGSSHRIVPGMKFLVARRGKQGRLEYKGEVEVKKVTLTWSQVSITQVFNAETPSTDVIPVIEEIPMVDGDLAVNPLFHPWRPVVVAFVGNERPSKLKYVTDEARRRMQEIGVEVREVTPEVDFLIFTEAESNRQRESYEGYKKAVQLEIPIQEASEIYKFLGD